MPNDLYTKTGNPPEKGDVDSSSLRAEFALIEQAFLRLAQLSGNAGLPIFVNAAESGYECKTAEQARTLLSAEYTENKDGSGGYVGLTDLKINFKNTAGDIYSFLTNANTVSRTYTFPDADGTVMLAGDSLTFGGAAKIEPTATGGTVTGSLTISANLTCNSLTVTNTISEITTTMGSASDKVPVESAIIQWLTDNGFYKFANILGTVSQSGGTPTGAIVETGENANGVYVRFADGTQWCRASDQSSSTGDKVWTFPAVFVGSVFVYITPGYLNNVTPVVRVPTWGEATTSSVPYSVVNASESRVAADVNILAIGRWF